MEASLLPHFDATIRKKGLGGKKGAWAKELEGFFHKANQCSTAMDVSIRANAVGNWLSRTHELRLAAGAIGARKLAGFCSEAEQMRNLRGDGAKAILYHIDKEIAYLREHID